MAVFFHSAGLLPRALVHRVGAVNCKPLARMRLILDVVETALFLWFRLFRIASEYWFEFSWWDELIVNGVAALRMSLNVGQSRRRSTKCRAQRHIDRRLGFVSVGSVAAPQLGIVFISVKARRFCSFNRG